MKYLGNAVSPNMADWPVSFNIEPMTREEFAKAVKDAKSVYGHAQSAPLVAAEIGREVELNRVSLHLTEDDELFLAQYDGPRLEEGAISLPEGAKFKYARITISYPKTN